MSLGRILLAACAAAALGCTGAPAAEAPREARQTGDARAMRARAGWLSDLDSLVARLAGLDSAVAGLDGSAARAAAAREAFHAARASYKRLEFIAAYYEPTTADLMNGPGLPRVEDEEGPEAIFPPEGFQVVEEGLFPEPDTAARDETLTEVRNLAELATRLRTAATRQVATDDRVWDAARLQIARVAALGLAGFDSPAAGASLAESASALDGVRDALARYGTGVDSALRVTATVLGSARDAEAFDRFAFVVRHLHPLARVVDAERDRLGIERPAERRAFVGASLFERGAFDAMAFAAPGAAAPSEGQIALGRRLFHEPRLSGAATRSCATCHDPARAFTDGQPRSVALGGGRTARNAPSVINVGLQLGSFHDLRATYLEDQVTDVVRNRAEMHGSLEAAAARLAADSSYRRDLASAFGGLVPRLTGEQLRLALAAYLRTLTALDSRMDRALRGDTALVTAEERRGFNLFMGRAKCGSCHFAPLYNGTVPPAYQETEVEVLGVPSRAVRRGARVDPDVGRFGVTRAAPHRFAFRTSTVRNVQLTAPYMHNGVYRTLEEVVEFYDRGGGAGIGIALPNQTLPSEPLKLTAGEKRALVAFMRSLTDTAGTTRR